MMRYIPAAFISLLFTLTASAQDIDSTLATYASKYGQEKIWLHYDKSTYSAGETIWFKVYMLEGIFPADGSANFYADWTDDKGELISRTVSPLLGGTTNGQVDVPAGYTGKYIHVKAYTKWMLNFDSAFLYNKDIRILGTPKPGAAAKTTITPSLQFFPEGGDAVAGIAGKIAFKANDQFGRPVKIKGAILNDAGTVVDTLHVQHDGMGYCLIIPRPGESYKAKWKDEKGTEYTTPLPPIRPHGVALQVGTSSGKRFFQVSVSPADTATSQMIHVIGTMNQHEVFKVSRDISSQPMKGAIPVQELPSGILTITVFNAQWQPLAERITYINNEEYVFTPEMEVEHWGLNKRARNDVRISVPDSIGASLSISITDAAIDSDSSNTIISHLLMTGDLRGAVYNAAYYFSGNNDTIARNLDLVMLTHGWRRFKWDDVVQGKFPAITYPRDSSYLSLSGRVYGVTPSQITDAGPLILIVQPKKQPRSLLTVAVDANGSFNDPSTILYDTAHIYYQFMKAKAVRDVTVRFYEGKLSPFRSNMSAKGLYNTDVADTTGFYRHSLLSDQAAAFLKQYEGKLLENVIVKSKTKSPVDLMDDKYSSGLFKGGDGYQFDLVNDVFAISAQNIFTYLQGKVAGLQITNTGATTTLQWRGGSPQVYLDEVPTDIDMVSNIPVSDIAYVKAFRPPFMGGFNGANGAIAIYTRRGDDVKASADKKGLANNIALGYSEVREFYSPNYSSFKPEFEKIDIRSTLYWNPEVIMDGKKNSVLLSFYNNDICKSFRVIIEGMTRDGRLAHIEQIME